MILRFLLIALLALPAIAAEGKWTPEQVLQLDAAWLRKQGLELPANRLWDRNNGTGLLAAAVSIGGCSAAFISETGLIATNHHCLFSILQEHATPADDIITNGFIARAKDRELPSKTLRVTIPRRFTEVTREVEAAVPQGVDDLERQKAIEAKQKQLVAACEKRPFARCNVAVFDGGVQYVLVDTTELPDVRLVYAPPRAVGEFGGEVDNWMWPRHTGDFSIARAYVAPDGSAARFSKDNVPYKPQFWFPIAREGVKPGDFLMVLGYPGITYRSLTAEEMAERRELFFPGREDLYGEYIRTMEETTTKSPEGAIALASNLKSLHNRYKNAQGQIAGFERGRILDKQREQEDAVARWAASKREYSGALAARDELRRIVHEQRRTWQRDFLLSQIPAGSVALAHATILVRLAAERQKPDAQREQRFMERELVRLRDRLDREQKNYYIATDKALLAAWVRRASQLPARTRIAALDKFFSAGARERIDALYGGTKVTERAERLKMFQETPEQLRARNDPFLEFAFALEPELLDLKQRDDRREGAILRLRPQWRKAVIAHAGKPVAPDANGTLRVSFAHVKGYSPRDGVLYTPQTRLRGMLEKHTGKDPFDVPEAVRRAASDGRHDNLPVNFLSDADTTGGNSGSPVVNGRGELVGLNFDRVWENVANDFGYNPEIARNISVDVRYLRWLLQNASDAARLLSELDGGAR